jgi:hypothetical protein
MAAYRMGGGDQRTLAPAPARLKLCPINTPLRNGSDGGHPAGFGDDKRRLRRESLNSSLR